MNKNKIKSLKKGIVYLFISLIVLNLIISLNVGMVSIKKKNNIPNSSQYSENFDLDYMQCNVSIELDGSLTIQYAMNFTNKDFSDPISVVDVGFPTKDYILSSVNATFTDENGIEYVIPKSSIKKSTYIDIGVEIWLYGHYLNYQDSGMLYVEAKNPKMVYQDYENQSMASVVFSPTWFDSSYCSQYDYLEMNIIFPSTVNISAEGITKWYYSEPEDIFWENNLMIFSWKDTNLPMKQYKYGVAFPQDAIDYAVPWTADPSVINFWVNILLWISGVGFVVGLIYFIVRYFRVTKKRYYPPKKVKSSAGTKCCIGCYCAFFVAIFGFAIFEDLFINIITVFVIYGVIITGFTFIGYMLYRFFRKIRLPYSKPEIMVDTVGVKKGLSVVEAAVIRNTPINKVVFLIIFGLIKTGHLEITDMEPLKFNVIESANPDTLRWYHREFLDLIIKSGARKGEVSESKLRELIIDLIKKTYTRMKGNDLDATIKYYDNMIKKAWQKVETLPNEIEFEDIENEFLWLISDDLFEERSDHYFRRRYYTHRPYWYSRYYYYPYYYRRYGYYNHYYRPWGYRPWYRPWGYSRPSGRLNPTTVPTERLNIASFSNSIAKSVESVSNNIVSNFTSFAEGIVNKVRPIIKPSGGSSSGGRRSYSGGGGCACACACACAGCACACAGGGR